MKLLILLLLLVPTYSFATDTELLALRAIDTEWNDPFYERKYAYNFTDISEHKGYIFIYYTQFSLPAKRKMCVFEGKIADWQPDINGHLKINEIRKLFLCIGDE